MKTFIEFLAESCPPGMEQWCADNAQAFQDQHGSEWQTFLLSAAWTIYRRAYIAPFVDGQ